MTVPDWSTQYTRIDFDSAWASAVFRKYDKLAYQWLSDRSLLKIVFDTPIFELSENTGVLRSVSADEPRLATRFAVVYDLAAAIGEQLPQTDRSLYEMYTEILYAEELTLTSPFPDFYVTARRLQHSDLRASPQYTVTSSVAPDRTHSQLWTITEDNQTVVVTVSGIQFRDGEVVCESTVKDVLTERPGGLQLGDTLELRMSRLSPELTT